MCDLDDWSSGNDCSRTISRKARKPHKCCACRETIRVGDVYMYTSGIYDGTPGNVNHCLRCWQIVDELMGRAEGSVDFYLACGELWEDNYGPLPDDVARLAFMTPDEAQQKFVHGY